MMNELRLQTASCFAFPHARARSPRQAKAWLAWHGVAWHGMVWLGGSAKRNFAESWLFVIWQLLKSHPRVLAPVLVARCLTSRLACVKILYR